MPDILIIDADYERIGETIDRVFAAFPLEVKGRRVLLKPNLVGAYASSRRVTTHPAVVRACVERLRRDGAEVTVGDNPGVMGYGMNEKVAEVTGIREAAGESYRNISREAAEVPLRSEVAPTTIVSRAVLDADVLISLPRFKTHMTTLISGAIKNSYGILAGGEKARFHRLSPEPGRFSRLVAEVFALRPPDLIIMDAIEAMEGDGPSGKDFRPLGKFIASRDAVALDTLMAAIMGLRPADVPMLKAAEEMGLGKTDIQNLEINGEWAPLPGFKLPKSFIRKGRLGEFLNRTWGTLFSRPTLRIDPRACRRCGVCFRQCPGEAIEKSEAGFRINRNKCLRCYCCYELCAYDAVRIGSPLQRLLTALIRKREGL